MIVRAPKWTLELSVTRCLVIARLELCQIGRVQRGRGQPPLLYSLINFTSTRLNQFSNCYTFRPFDAFSYYCSWCVRAFAHVPVFLLFFSDRGRALRRPTCKARAAEQYNLGCQKSSQDANTRLTVFARRGQPASLLKETTKGRLPESIKESYLPPPCSRSLARGISTLTNTA